MEISDLPTPALLLDHDRLRANIARMQASADRLGVRLRPHLKTMKAARAAEAVIEAGAKGITVSTLREADYFLEHGFRDITYAVGILPSRLPAVTDLMRRGAELKILTDSPDVAGELARYARNNEVALRILVEIDCGDHRGGLPADSDELLEIADRLASGPASLCGVLTHAGHSYAVASPDEVAAVAEQERAAVVLAAERLRAAGTEIEIVSVGSTPTALFAQDLSGVTEMRAGVYTVFDMDQQSRGVCATGEIAMSVLASVIGHNRAAGKILLDTGGLALSKDRSADRFRPEVGYGQVCDLQGVLIPDLYVSSVSQEHGHVKVRDASDFDSFPVGIRLRILPVHACMTAAAYDYFNLLENEQVVGRWDRVNGW